MRHLVIALGILVAFTGCGGGGGPATPTVSPPSVAITPTPSNGSSAPPKPGTTPTGTPIPGTTPTGTPQPGTTPTATPAPTPTQTQSAVTNGEEFVGPFPSWANAKTDYGAKGDGVTDDTAALQAGLSAIGTPGKPAVLYLPAGTYKISRTLTLAAVNGVNVIGDDPATTSIVWAGGGGTMLQLHGVSYSRFNRITWNGNGAARIIFTYFDGSNYFPVHDEWADDTFVNAQTCIQSSQGDGGDSDMNVVRDHFSNCGAGVRLSDYNALQWYIRDSLFENCGDGVTNVPGAGGFHVYASIFRNSTVADVHIGNTGIFSVRDSYSSGSQQFFRADGATTAGAPITLQKNTVVNSQTTPVSVLDRGPLTLLGNTFSYSAGPAVQMQPFGLGDIFSFGNAYASKNFSLVDSGVRVRSVDDVFSVAPGAPPLLPPTPPHVSRAIFEVPVGGSAADIQNAINAAVASGKPRPVVHLPIGDYAIPAEISIPANSDLQLIGDSYVNGSRLVWSGSNGTGAIVHVHGPSRAVIRDLTVMGMTGNIPTNNILIDGDDQPGARIFIKESTVENTNQQNALFVDGLSQADVRGDAVLTGSLATSIHINGNGHPVTPGVPGQGRVIITGGGGGTESSDPSVSSYALSNDGYYVGRDGWFEGQTQRYLWLQNGMSGTFVLQGQKISTNGDVQGGAIPGVQVDGFTGLFALLSSSPSGSARTLISSSATGAAPFVIGSGFGIPTNYFSDSANAPLAFLSDEVADTTGSAMPAPESGQTSEPFLKSNLAPAILEPSDLPPSTGPTLTIYRVFISNSSNGIHIRP